jgi:predicted dehydrogenase
MAHDSGTHSPDSELDAVGIAFVGCGYAADFYMATLPNHPDLVLRGVYDSNPARSAAFAGHHGVRVYPSFDSLLGDDGVTIVVNLTNPRSHYQVLRSCLESGKHAYSEKPLTQDFGQAAELVEMAERRGLTLAAAPAALLGNTAQTLWHALRAGAIGRPLLAYAELDDGVIHQMAYESWISVSGAPWPYADEFRVGPVLEHALYYLTWLTAFFGPATEVTAFSALFYPDKLPGSEQVVSAPDFACAGIRFESGFVARLTLGTVAPVDHSLRIIGDQGVLSVSDCWEWDAEVYLRNRVPASPESPYQYLSDPRIYPFVRSADRSFRYKTLHDMDFASGVADVADAVRRGARPRLDARHALHALEISLAIANTQKGQPRTLISSRFDALEPIPVLS